MVPSGAAAYNCNSSSAPNAQHCYALAQTSRQYEASWVNIMTNGAVLPGWEQGDRMQNEQWANFPDGGWIEAGNTVGTINYLGSSTTTPAPVYFFAVNEPAGTFFEMDYSNGPGFGAWFATRIGDVGGGTWCVDFGAASVYCKGGLPLYSVRTDAGLEVSAPDARYPSNNATFYAWVENLGSHAWTSFGAPAQWSWDHANCLVPFNTAINPPPTAFALNTPTGDPACFSNRFGAEGSVALASFARMPAGRMPAATVVVQAADGSVPPTPPGVPPFAGKQAKLEQPAAGFAHESGPLLTREQLASIGAAAAEESTEARAAEPTAATVYRSGTLGKALRALQPGARYPADGEGARRMQGSDVDVVELHGRFALETAPRPTGAKPPTGTTLTLVIDARSGELRARQLGDSSPAAPAGTTTLRVPLS